MPTCNKVNCAIVLPPTDTPLPEYRRKYLDSSVSIYVPVPDIPILHAAPSFNIHLWTDGYIAPGLAMFVYIDGHYQCNRSKRMPPPGSAGGCGIEMKLRQKEEKVAGGEGDFVGREWRWVHLDVEKANEANNVDRETQDRIGKIEVVVLRCADDELPPVERQMQTLRLEGASKKASEKAPSAKAPSIKPVSAKAPSAAASGGLGGFFGLFDGACDDYSDDASNEDADETLPASQPREAKNYHLPLGLDGQEYERPQTVFDRYGQPCGVRVPYRRNYDEAIRPEPGQTEHRRNVNANIDYFSTRGVPTRALSGHRPEKRYADAPVLMPFTPNTPQGPKVQQPRGTFAPAGPLYVPVYDQTPPQRPNYNSPAYNYIDPTGRTRYVVRDGVPKSYVDPQPPSYPVQVVEEPLRLPAILDPEFQRFQIFQMPGRIEAMLELDHKFVAASVPYMEQLKTTPIADLSFEDMQNMKRSLHKCLSRGFYPNGDPIKKEFSDPQAHETRSHRPRSRSRHAESSHKNAERSKAGDAGGKVMSWIGKDDQAASKHGKSQSGRGRSPTRSEKPLTISEASWGNNDGGNAQAIGDWNQQNDTSGEQNDGNNNGWGDDNNNQEKATEKSSTVWEFSLAGGGDGNQKKPEHAPASHHSKTSNTTNPHAYIQPYFQTWRSDGRTYTTKPLARQPREPYSYLPAPTPHIPSDQVGDRSHGVRAGKGADYTHKVRRPKYLDTMEDPYAVFIFNYRSAEKLEEILEKDIQADLKVVAEEVGRGVLMTLPREKLVEELLKSQAKAKSGDDGDAKKSGDAKRSKSGKSEGKKAKSAAAPSSHGQKPVNNWATGPSQEAAGQDAGFTPDDAGGKAKSANPGWQAAGEGFTAAEPKGGW